MNGVQDVSLLSQEETDLSALEMFERGPVMKSTSSSSDFETLGLGWCPCNQRSALHVLVSAQLCMIKLYSVFCSKSSLFITWEMAFQLHVQCFVCFKVAHGCPGRVKRFLNAFVMEMF